MTSEIPEDTRTPHELYADLDAVRRAQGLMWWQVAVKVRTDVAEFSRMRRGLGNAALRTRVVAWLEQQADEGRPAGETARDH